MRKAPLFVVPVDFAPEMEATVSAALALAKKRGTHVDLLEVVSRHRPSLLAERARLPLADPVTSTPDWPRLEDSIRAAERGGIHLRTVAYRGDPTQIIPSYLQLRKARLLVIDKHYGTPRWRRSPRIVATLSRAAPAPVLVVPPLHSRSEKKSALSFGHVVSAVDFTVASAVAVRTVLDLIRGTGARLTLVHALKTAPHHMMLSGFEAATVTRNLRERAAQVATQLRRMIPAAAKIRVDARVPTGDPHRGILDTASDVNADLIVMGVPPRSRFDEVLFGSTLRNVLRRATIPVLVLPVPAGAYRWLAETDGLDIALTPGTTARRKRLAETTSPRS
jgi:nucleotide-binding universal stress UspA family protein